MPCQGNSSAQSQQESSHTNHQIKVIHRHAQRPVSQVTPVPVKVTPDPVKVTPDPVKVTPDPVKVTGIIINHNNRKPCYSFVRANYYAES